MYDFRRRSPRKREIRGRGGVGLAPISLNFASYPHSTLVQTYYYIRIYRVHRNILPMPLSYKEEMFSDNNYKIKKFLGICCKVLEYVPMHRVYSNVYVF